MSTPWPYGDAALTETVPAPVWTCPEAVCVCGEEPDVETCTFSVQLRDHQGDIMPGARVRVFVNGRLVNDDHPYAQADSWLHLELARGTVTARVEWAPSHLPRDPIYPYVKTYYSDLREDYREEAARRRLHNVGFSHQPTLRENIKEYQREYGNGYVTGVLDHIEDELIAFHDFGIEPTVVSSGDTTS